MIRTRLYGDEMANANGERSTSFGCRIKAWNNGREEDDVAAR